MPVFDTYASRVRRAAQAGQPDVYVYDALPPFLRHQLNLIFIGCIGPGETNGWGQNGPAWVMIAGMLEREEESFTEVIRQRGRMRGGCAICMDYLTNELRDLNGVLSLIEICCRYIAVRAEKGFEVSPEQGITQHPKDGLEEINDRFRNAGVGFKFDAGRIMRVDSEYVHAEVVREALSLLRAPEFKEANGEFLRAHEHYRAGGLRDCNTAALRSMESVLKAICAARGWPHGQKTPLRS